ncbi:lipid-A-disaccharide synthase-related protein [Synechococcus sp. M16CYN]|uniref:lipid-A-disaccharide synthase-related protein n=1 Tax=Synechococcus sp. M16CYN TaxID=3103139 RepID=UPI0032440DA8
MICNGHGEDLIALRVLEALHRQRPQLLLEVLPLFGYGRIFDAAVAAGWLNRIGPVANLPSGGFSNQSIRGMVRDIWAGLPLLSWWQWQLVKRQARQRRSVVAIGDVLPLLMAWSSGAPFGFIGTPKSDYTWRSGPGRSLSDLYHQLKGSEWDPWEWMLMRSERCRLVAMRDLITARGLRRHRVPAVAPGNPMMDGLELREVPSALKGCRRILVLCGSRIPEAQTNFDRILNAISLMHSAVPIALLVAIGGQPSTESMRDILQKQGFRQSLPPSDQLGAEACWVKGPCILLIGQSCFDIWSGWSEVGLATAGTATEQLVGLGIPALSSPGPGPQFKKSFAYRQSRLLGGSVRPCTSPTEMAIALECLLADENLRRKLGYIGRQRMGRSGGSDRLATMLLNRLH